MKKALIVGVFGQIGIYLSRILIQKGYQVHGTGAADWSPNVQKVSSRFPLDPTVKISELRYSDPECVKKLMRRLRPDEIYVLEPANIGTEHVRPRADVNIQLYVPLLVSILDMMRALSENYKPRLFHACQNDLFAAANTPFQTESNSFVYTDASVAVFEKTYTLCSAYRNAYNLHVTNGIFFGCFSPHLDESSFARYVSKSLAELVFGQRETIMTGDLSVKRDRVHASDCANGMYLALQQENGNDYIFASGISARREILFYHAAKPLGMTIRFHTCNGKQYGYLTDLDEDMFIKRIGAAQLPRMKGKLVGPDLPLLSNTDQEKSLVISGSFENESRESSMLLGDYSKAKEKLNWYPRYHFADVIKEMIFHDVHLVKNINPESCLTLVEEANKSVL